MLRSNWLDLRSLEASDAEFVASLYANAHVTRTLLRIQRPTSIEEAKEFCQVPVACGEHRFGAALRGDGILIAVGSVRMDAEVPDTATIGYSVLPEFWGQGLGTELAALLVKLAADALGSARVLATTLDDNPAFARVLQKLGFMVLEAGACEIDSRGDVRHVTRWILYERSFHSPRVAERQTWRGALPRG